MVTADRLALDILKKGGQYREVLDPDIGTVGRNGMDKGEAKAFDQIEQAELCGRLLSSLREHNRGQYEAIMHTYCKGMGLAEAGKHLGMTYSQIANRIQRGKNWLRREFREEYEQDK